VLLEPAARRLRKKREETIESLKPRRRKKIAGYRFRLFWGRGLSRRYVDPTRGIRRRQGYTDRAGVAQPYAATFSGLYYRRGNQGPYMVPQRWVDLRAAMDLVTPLDFVSTCDIGGGDYGSPVVNRAGELVGVTFDGNLESRLTLTSIATSRHAPCTWQRRGSQPRLRRCTKQRRSCESWDRRRARDFSGGALARDDL